MNTECKKWLDKKLLKLQGSEIYSAEKTNEEIARQYGLKTSDIVKLNYNENLYIPREKVIPLLKEVAEECDFRIYPQEEEARLKEKISEYLQVPIESVTMGNSSDEVMERVIRIFLEAGDSAVTFVPTFSVFKYCVKYQGVEYVPVPLNDDFTINVEGMRKAFTPNARLLYLCSPNNPTSNQMNAEDIETLVKVFPGIVILDEAYGEFADYSFVPRIRDFPNMIILRTFSKAFGLAMLRLGYTVANPELTRILTEKAPLPYPVSGFTIRMGIKMLDNMDIMRTAVSALVAERGKLIKALNQIEGVQAFNSQADFLLINTEKPADEVYEKLLKRGVMLKKWGKILDYPNCFRVTVGLPEMNKKLIEALKEIQGD